MKRIFETYYEGICNDIKGVGTDLLMVSIIITLIGGTVLGFGIASAGFGEDDSSNISELEFQKLKRKVALLENGSMSGLTSLSTAENSWLVDEIYKFAENSVVEISVKKTSVGFYESTQTSLGSGFVYDLSGHIITNQHVVEGADEILVKFYNGETVKARVTGSDPYSDLAVLEVNPAELNCSLNPLPLGNSSKMETGDRIVALGNPYGLEGSTSFGIVSQTGRVLSSGTQYLIPGVIQIDAPINPGNSGGPLLDFNGRVVGITTAIQSQTGSFSGIGYAVPSNLVKRVAENLIEHGEYMYAWLGIQGKKITYDIAQQRDLERVTGFLVEGVRQDGPSAGKVKQNDIILELDGREVRGIGDILSYLALKKSPGEEVTLNILRGGERTTVTVELGTRPSTQ